MLFVMQRLIFTIVLTVLFRIYLAQFILLAIMHIAMMLYMGIGKPFETFQERASSIIDESILVVFLVYTLILYYAPEMSIADKRKYAYPVLALITFCIIKNFSFGIYYSLQDCKENRKRKKEEKNRKEEEEHKKELDRIQEF